MPHLLIIEPRFDVRDLMRSYFERAGYRVSTASDGDEGLRHARERPDAILIDVAPPALDGLATAAAIRADAATRHIPLIALSTSVRAREACPPFDVLFPKPLDVRSLRARIGELIGKGTQ